MFEWYGEQGRPASGPEPMPTPSIMTVDKPASRGAGPGTLWMAPGTSLLDYKGFQLDLEGRMAAGVPSVPFRMVGVVQVNVVV